MIKSFRLPVTQEQSIAVTYQRPDDYPAGPEPLRKKQPVKKPRAKAFMNEPVPPPEPPPRKPLVVMMHDFPGGHMSGTDDLFGELEFRFEKMGYPSVRFDFRGSGESDCTAAEFTLDSALEDLNAVMQWAQHDAGHRSIILLGEGVGATIAVMGCNPKTVFGIMLLWPALILKDTWFNEMFTREARLEMEKRNAPFVPFREWRLGIHFFNDIYKTDLRGPLERVKCPVFIQHGTADELIPVEQTYFARDHLGGPAELAVFEGGNHGLRAANMRKVLFTNVEYFLAKILKKLDLGA